MVGGLRYDYYNSQAARPFMLDTVSSSATFGQYSYFPTPNSYGGGGVTFDVNGTHFHWCKYQDDPSHDYLSPHIQVSFPVTDRTNFRLSYAHQVQAPDFNLILGGINTDLRVTNTNHSYGSDLDFGKTITFEFGIRHAFSDDMVLDISAYNKDILSDAAGRLVSFPDPARLGENVDIRIFTNADFGNARGIDLRLDRRIGRFFNGVLSLHLPGCQEHRVGSVHLHQLRLPDHQPDLGWEPAAAAGHLRDRQQPAAQPGGLLRADPAERLAGRHHHGLDPEQRGRDGALPLLQRHGLHQVPGGDR